MSRISIITPWRNCPELIPAYETLTQGAGTALQSASQVVIVDNGSAPMTAQRLWNLCQRNGGVYVRSERNLSFAAANNRGFRYAQGDIVIFMNNDVVLQHPTNVGAALVAAQSDETGQPPFGRGLPLHTGPVISNTDWLSLVRRDVEPGALYGPALASRYVDGRPVLYIEGWCIAARKETWQALSDSGQLWDAAAYPGAYWEDNDLCFRAMQAGLKLRRTDWPLTHLNNYTSKQTPGAYAHSAANQAMFEARVRATWR